MQAPDLTLDIDDGQTIDGLLRACTVRITLPSGTVGSGFFVAPGLILTCAHVVTEAYEHHDPITVIYRRQTFIATINRYLTAPSPDPNIVYPDLALLVLGKNKDGESCTDHPCVLFDPTLSIGDEVRTFGYTTDVPGGSSAQFTYEGPDYEPYLLRLKQGQGRPGLSGGPLLNHRTGGVCGVVKRSRDPYSDLGARAIPVQTVFQELKDLEDLQRQFHARDATWTRRRDGGLLRAEEIYRRQVAETYGTVRFDGLGMENHPITELPLEGIFVRLALLPVMPNQRDGQHDDRLNSSTDSLARNRDKRESIEIADALRTPLLVVGEPGAGKSTLLRWLAVTFAQGTQQQPDKLGPSADSMRLPILVELGRLPTGYLHGEGTEIVNWLSFLPQYISSLECFHDTPPTVVRRAIEDGRCIVLFDGLDEVADPKARARVARSIAESRLLKFGNQVVLGSRPGGVSHTDAIRRHPFRRCNIAPMTSEDLKRFFRAWYSQDERMPGDEQQAQAAALYERVTRQPRTLALARTPLLATILVLVWQNREDLPARRTELYEHCCRILIERWETQKDVVHTGVLGRLGWERHMHVLAPAAFMIHARQERVTATRGELVASLAKSLEGEGLVSGKSAIVEAEEFLGRLSSRSGLLQSFGNDLYGFPHLTFQEYLAALHMASQPESRCTDLLMEHLHEPWWREVHLLTIGVLGSKATGAAGASRLISTILNLYKPPSLAVLRLQLSRFQQERQLAWLLDREFEFALKGCDECAPDGITGDVKQELWRGLTKGIPFAPMFPDPTFASAHRAMVAAQSPQSRFRDWGVSALLQVLREGDGPAREIAAQCLGKIGQESQEVVAALVAALQDPEGFVREAAARSLGVVGTGDERVITPLLEIAGASDMSQGGEAAQSLIQISKRDERVVAALERAVANDHGRERWRAAGLLVRIGKSNEHIVDALLEVLRRDDPFESPPAAWWLGVAGEADARVVPALLRALSEGDSWVRPDAASSLKRLSQRNNGWLGPLLESLHDCNVEIRWTAAMTLGQIGMVDDAVVTILLEALEQGERAMRLRAAESLRWIGQRDERVVPALLRALSDDAVSVRTEVIQSLVRSGQGSESVLQALLVALKDEEWEVREEAAIGLGFVGEGDDRVIRALIEALKDDWLVRMYAAESLGKIGSRDKRAIAALREALNARESGIQRQAASALGMIGQGDELVIADLLQALTSESRDVRSAAVRSLVKIGQEDERVVGALLRASHRRRDFDQRAVTQSIRELVGDGPLPGYRWIPLSREN